MPGRRTGATEGKADESCHILVTSLGVGSFPACRFPPGVIDDLSM